MKIKTLVAIALIVALFGFYAAPPASADPTGLSIVLVIAFVSAVVVTKTVENTSSPDAVEQTPSPQMSQADIPANGVSP